MQQALALTFPKELEFESYRSMYSDLAQMTDDQLFRHFEDYGRAEGRGGNSLRDRKDFVSLISTSAKTLEIGPFCAPVLSGTNIRYFDVLDQAGLEKRAMMIGLDYPRAPFIDFVSPDGDLSIVNETFDFVISSHCVEHQPDLIGHLQNVSRLLVADGCYFLLVPDKRFCFDALLAESSIAEILSAHFERRKVHTLSSVVEHRALTTHNDAVLHWTGQHGDPEREISERIIHALAEYDRASGSYIDVHAWQFTPASMIKNIGILFKLAYIDLQVERIYDTRRNSNEFWCILKKHDRRCVIV